MPSGRSTTPRLGSHVLPDGREEGSAVFFETCAPAGSTSERRESFWNSDTFSIKLDIDYKQILIFFVILAAVFTATVIFPVRNLRKMKISEQIKYE